ncbi:unnamed protein product, partial [Oppiella nova]
GIYGLLGSSGCGKTTLLRCALGRLRPKSGSISLFGHIPGTALSRVPGPGVGYMPQELALYDDFSIEETLVYFGRLFGIKSRVIDSRIEFMVDLLQLPNRRKLIVELSGGQKRRVSLATALLHNPPLLILDEPTVGVDLILRETIWKHLENLCKTGLTVILTTHYIEEARNAAKVGFMRSGRILAEDSPHHLLRRHQLMTLEEVFLKLSQLDDQTKVHHINKKSRVIDSRIEFMVDLLQLPNRRKLIVELSGGQKRRVSLATALLHNPPLLILDEPTVGVDLILRETIWKHLENLCKTGLTVILTTHYIEEARNAAKVGFMRSGRILAEDSPHHLLRRHQLMTLEEVFLKLSQLDDQTKVHHMLTYNRKSIPNEIIET